MKKPAILITVIFILVVTAGLLLWCLWPGSYVDVLGMDMESVTGISLYACVDPVEDGQRTELYYRMDHIPMTGEGSYEEILEILNDSRYHRNIRNIFPWIDDEYEYPTRNKDYAGNSLSLTYYLGSEEHFIYVSFFSKSLVLCFEDEFSDIRFFHPTNPETLNRLIDFIYTYGEVS